MYPVQILPAGDAALLIQLPQAIDASVNGWCVAFADDTIRRHGTAVRDAVVGYCSVTVYFDPVRTDPEWLEKELLDAATAMGPTTASRTAVPCRRIVSSANATHQPFIEASMACGS